MKKKTKTPRLGQLTFRMPPEVHQELLYIARAMGLDLSGLLNAMLNEIRPVFLDRATAMFRSLAESQRMFNELALPLIPPDPGLLFQAVEAGRQVHDEKDRMRVILQTLSEPGTHTSAQTSLAAKMAMDLLEKEDKKQAWDHFIKEWEAGRGANTKEGQGQQESGVRGEGPEKKQKGQA
jgi:hypothetical protein